MRYPNLKITWSAIKRQSSQNLHVTQHNQFSEVKLLRKKFQLRKCITKVLFLGMKEFDKDLMTVYRYFQHIWDTNTVMFTKLSKILPHWSISHYQFHALFSNSRSFHIFSWNRFMLCIGSSEKGFEKQLNFLDIYTSHFFDTFFLL